MNRLLTIAVVVAAASATAFQKTGSAPGTPTFSSTTRLIQVNVVAVDNNGKPVADLRKEDFSLFEDGRPQTASVFVPEQAKPIKPPVLPPNEFSNQLASTSSTRSGYTVILIDWLNSNMAGRIASQQQVLKLLKQVELTDLISICVLDGGLRVLHDFTADRAELQRKLSAAYMGLHEGPPGEKAAIADFAVFPTDIAERSPGMDVAERRNTRALEIRRNLDTFSVVEQIASYLGTASGRKSMIWVTSGFSSAMGFDHSPEEYKDNPDAYFNLMADDNRGFSKEINRLIRRLNDADIAVYPVDARGVIADERAGGAYVNRAPLNEIAKGTGGRAYYDANDLDNAVRSALDDSRISYTLGYYSTNSKSDGNYRNVSVKVQRPGVTLRYRTGYEAEKSEKKAVTKVDLGQVFGSPLDTTALPLSARAVRAGKKLDVSLRINPSSLTLRLENGRRKGAITVLYTFRPGSASGKVQVFSEMNKIELPDGQYAKLLQQGFRTFRKQIPMPADATSIRIALRDEESGLIGSVTIPLSAVR